MSQHGASPETRPLTAQSSLRDVPCRGDHRAGINLARAKGAWRHLGSWDMGSRCRVLHQGPDKARPWLLRGLVEVLQWLPFIWTVASAQRCPGMQRPWGWCQRWDGVLLPWTPLQMHLVWLLGAEIAVGGEGWSVGAELGGGGTERPLQRCWSRWSSVSLPSRAPLRRFPSTRWGALWKGDEFCCRAPSINESLP